MSRPDTAEEVAAKMLGCDSSELPDDLAANLAVVRRLIRKYKGYGGLSSSQVIACLVVDHKLDLAGTVVNLLDRVAVLEAQMADDE